MTPIVPNLRTSIRMGGGPTEDSSSAATLAGTPSSEAVRMAAAASSATWRPAALSWAFHVTPPHVPFTTVWSQRSDLYRVIWQSQPSLNPKVRTLRVPAMARREGRYSHSPHRIAVPSGGS